MSSNELVNFYNVIPNKYKKKTHNPNWKKHKIELPFRALIVGPSGSMKTNLVLNILKRMKNTFNFMFLVVKNKHEPLYEYLLEKAPEDVIEVVEMNSDDVEIPTPEELIERNDIREDEQVLAIFDDLVLDKQRRIQDYYIRGRKLNISSIFLTQSYYKTDKTIRINSNYILLKSQRSNDDLKKILDDFSINADLNQLKEMYRKATKKKQDFFMVETVGTGISPPFRKNFLEFLNP